LGLLVEAGPFLQVMPGRYPEGHWDCWWRLAPSCRLRQVGTMKVTGIAGGGWPLPAGYAR